MANRRLTPDELRSALAFATNVSEQALIAKQLAELPEGSTNTPQSPEMGVGEEVSPEGVESPEQGVQEPQEAVVEEVEEEEDSSIEELSENINKRFDELESKIEEGDKRALKKSLKQ